MDLLKQLREDYYARIVLLTLSSSVLNLVMSFHYFFAIFHETGVLFSGFAAYYLALGVLRLYGLKSLNEKDNGAFYQQLTSFSIILIALGTFFTLLTVTRTGESVSYDGSLIYIAGVYTFFKFVSALYNLLEDRKKDDHIISCLRSLSYTDASISLLILQGAVQLRFSFWSQSFDADFFLDLGILVCILMFLLGINLHRSSKRISERNSAI